MTSGVKDLISRVENWKTCPWCKEEWSKLRPIQFFMGKESVHREICVRCAETVMGLPYAAKYFPMAGGDISMEKTFSYKAEILPRQSIAKISYGSMSFTVGSEGFGLWVQEEGTDFAKRAHYDNTVQVWLKISNQIKNPSRKIEIPWGSRK